MSEYYSKYIKYKQKYHNLKNQIGGGIGIDRKLLPEEIIYELEIPKIPGLKIKEPKKNNALESEYNYDVVIKSLIDVIMDNSNNYIWSYDTSKSYIIKRDSFIVSNSLTDNTNHDKIVNNKPREPILTLRRDGMRSKFYVLPDKVENANTIKDIIKNSRFITPDYNQNIPYKYTPHFFVNCIPFNLFTNVHNKKFNEINDQLCLNWLTRIYNNIKKTNMETSMDNPDELRTIHLVNLGIVGLNVPGQPTIILSNLETHSFIKIHLNVKLEYLFWTLEKIISNLKKFIVNNNLIITQFKFINKFCQYNGILETFFSDYPYLYEPDKKYNPKDNTWEFRNNPNIKYKFEDIYEPNIVIYIKKEDDYTLLKNNVQNIIRNLVELFPDSLNIGSEKFPRFNYKVNNTIYFAIGDSKEKMSYTYKKNYTKPLDLHECKCREKNIEECRNFNLKIKNIIDKEPCRIHGDKCMENNIYSLDLMTYINPIPHLYKTTSNDEINNFNTLEEIYNFLGQPIPN